jgi:hypothetical protein
MRIEFDLPDDMELRGLSQSSRGFIAYVGPKGSFYLQGMIGGTPQEAVDNATARVRSGVIARGDDKARSNNSSTLTLDDLDF